MATSTALEDTRQLIREGQFLSAYQLATEAWGNIESWQTLDQQLIAIRLYYHLGADRSSDAVLVHAYRKMPDNPKLIERMLYYFLYKRGPILCEEYLHEKENALGKEFSQLASILCFKSVLYRELKHFVLAEQCLNLAKQQPDPPDFIDQLEVRLLQEQDLDEQALTLAKQGFESDKSLGNLRTLVSVVQKVEDSKSAAKLLQQHAHLFQSTSLQLQLASMCAAELDWDCCRQALSDYQTVKLFADKYDDKRISNLHAQLALSERKFEQASELLSEHKTGYWNIVRENLQQAPKDAQIKVLDVPFLRQQHLTCAPTTIAAIAQFWGKKHASKDIADAICFSGTPDTKERQWLRDNGFSFVEFDLSYEALATLIDASIPFGLVTTSGFTAHLQAVIGYNQFVGSMYVMDPSSSGMQEMLVKQTIESEKFSGGRCIAFVPSDKAELLEQFTFPESSLYELWDNYAVARENNDAETMQATIRQMREQAPEHRISVTSARYFAVWQREYAEVLRLNELLIKDFPHETVLLNSQYFCLRDLGRRAEGLDKLQAYLDKNHNLSLSCVLMGQIFDTNERPEVLQKQIALMKRYGSYLEDAHFKLGHYYWTNRQREKALHHYFIAHCLDDTSDDYLQRFFKASRHLDKEQTAIDALHQRYEKYKNRSPLPAISLFKAYEYCNKEHQGFALLKEAFEQHKADPELAKFLANKFIELGMFEEFADYHERFEQCLSDDDLGHLEAKKWVREGKLTEASAFYADIFNKHPFLQQHAENYFTILKRTQQQKELDKRVYELYQKHPAHSLAQDYVISWHSDDQVQEQVLQQAVAERPDNGYLRRSLISKLLRLGKKQKALELALQTVEVIPSDVQNHSYLANVYLSSGEFELAEQFAKQALGMDVDDDTAFNVLMGTSKNEDQSREHLSFAFAELKKQVTTADGAWNYWFSAQNVVTNEQLAEFIDFVVNHLSHLWHSYVIAALYQKQLGDLASAINYLQDGVERFPLTPRIYKELGHVYELQGDQQRAIDNFKIALQINPSWSEVAKHMASLYEKRNEFVQATEVIETTIKHEPDDGVLYGYAADYALKQGNDEAALLHLTKAVEYNTDYNWAWSQINGIGERTNRPALAKNLAKELADKYPYLGQVWCNLASTCDDADEKLSYLQKAQNVSPMNKNTYLLKAQCYCHTGDYQAALDVFNDTPWKQDLPYELLIEQANVNAYIGKLEKAIEIVKSIVFQRAENVNLWDKLYGWLIELEKHDEIIQACYKQIELNKFDADSLCSAAEYLNRLGDDNDKAQAFDNIQRAYELAPNSQYIVLSWADVNIEKQDYEKAREILCAFKAFSDSPYALAREVRCLLNLNQIEQAKVIYQDILEHQDSNDWCLSYPLEKFAEAKKLDEILPVLEAHLPKCNDEQAYIWGRNLLMHKGDGEQKRIVKTIGETANKDLKTGAFYAILEYWNSNEKTPNVKLIKEFEDLVVSSCNVFEQACISLLNNGKYLQIIALYKKYQDPTELSMFSMYQVRAAYQISDKWEEAATVIELGMQKTPDNSIHNMRLWCLYENWRRGHTVSEEELELIDTNELIDCEQYVFTTLRVPAILGDRDIESGLDDITPALRVCQRVLNQIDANWFVQHAQKLLKKRLAERISSTNFLQKLLYKWKLSNRF